jgi:hypothetical protein
MHDRDVGFTRGMNIKEYDIVSLLHDLPEEGLRKGAKGTVHQILFDPTPAYLVEFSEQELGHFNIVPVSPESVEKIDSK